MIYFLVNNNFQLLDVETHLAELKNDDISLIKIPHNLTISLNYKFKEIYEFPRLINKLVDHFKLPQIISIHSKIKNNLKEISEKDTLIFYTEYEYLNHYVVNIFKEKKAKVILIDEGFATYLSYSILENSNLGLKKKILNLYLKSILGYKNTKIVSLGQTTKTHLTDSQIDLLLLYNPLNLVRKVKTNHLKTDDRNFIGLKSNTALFLNERMYDYYVTMYEYLNIMNDILLNLSNNFETVYFKFHPRETDFEKNKIKSVIEKHPKVKIIEDNNPVELLIEKIEAKYIVSFFAQTLLYLSNSNCTPIYTIQMYPQLMKNESLKVVNSILENMGYISLNNWSEIKNENIGFTQKNKKSNSLQYYIDTINEK
jgi:hypothetical protein